MWGPGFYDVGPGTHVTTDSIQSGDTRIDKPLQLKFNFEIPSIWRWFIISLDHLNISNSVSVQFGSQISSVIIYKSIKKVIGESQISVLQFRPPKSVSFSLSLSVFQFGFRVFFRPWNPYHWIQPNSTSYPTKQLREVPFDYSTIITILLY